MMTMMNTHVLLLIPLTSATLDETANTKDGDNENYSRLSSLSSRRRRTARQQLCSTTRTYSTAEDV